MGSLPQQVIGTGVTGATAAGTAMAVVAAPYDSSQFQEPGNNIPALITFPATVGKRWIISALSAGYFAGTGGVVVSSFVRPVLVDVATGVTKWGFVLTVPALVAGANASQYYPISGLSIAGSLGGAVTFSCPAMGAAIFIQLSASAYQV